MNTPFVSTMEDIEGYQDQLQKDAQFLCTEERMDTELVDRLVLQLNRIYPQILNDKEAHKFRNLSMPTKVRLPELLKHLQWKGEEACHEFYRGLHIHAEDIYFSLPTRVQRREMADPKRAKLAAVRPEKYVLNDRGPMFFLTCFSFAVCLAVIYYYGEGETLRGTAPFLHCSAAGLGSRAKNILLSCVDAGTKRK
ncbi:caspase recruitment domain-containing protein 19-like isoform X2 [Lampris incognitus]|uniref:caspase recruitment domain-containing protein 19-like isoform X2 n=1 Tax=Lampris incognitus TaxID=2546036 RepID=UPI0024B4F3FD|nr:caspase recruitment domain-containing protein 19-like isoform X2 [Lampris incognitus]